jgi:hypothetical protein
MLPFKRWTAVRTAAALLLTLLLARHLVAPRHVAAQQQPATPSQHQCRPPHVPTVKRTIVEDLTTWLQDRLQEADVEHLVVIPNGPSSQSGSSSGTGMNIDWQVLNSSTATVTVDHVHSLAEFLHLGSRYIRGSQQRTPRRPLAARSTVAVLVQGSNGVVRMHQLALATAITKRLRRTHTISLQYSNHTDMGDSLVLFGRSGLPVEAAYAATSVFRDAFTQVYEKASWGQEGGGSGPGETCLDVRAIEQ